MRPIPFVRAGGKFNFVSNYFMCTERGIQVDGGKFHFLRDAPLKRAARGFQFLAF